ncbi:sensor histidine kinase [Sphingobium phenoxybenzoativorans]|nr:HAMP domain-containing sensor histidine kinase [Sphingobium phenoxybenzoativorans]
MVLSAIALLSSLGILIATSVWSHSSGARLLARVDMAHRQALLVTRLEADIMARTVADNRQKHVLDQSVRISVPDYLATIQSERALIGQDDESQEHQAREGNAAQHLAAMIDGPDETLDWMKARRLSHEIALREKQEAEEATLSIQDVQARIDAMIWSVALFILLLCAMIGFLLWRGIVMPIAALVEGTGKIAIEQRPARVRPAGLGELRNLATRFNSMASAVEDQVARRTGALQRANDELKDIDGRRRLFLSKVSHELRTPVTVMRGEAEVALRHPGDRNALHDALTHILDSSLFLQRRLDDLLTLARAEDGALALNSDRFDLGEVVRDAYGMAAPFALASGITLNLDCAPDIVPVAGDQERLCQALVAIIDNGVKFSPPAGSVTLHLQADKDRARIAISDEGPGVPEIELDRIFDPYVQTAAGRSRGGTGLGLSLARWIADKHGGNIMAANHRNGDGLCVSLSLPVLS